MVQISGTFIEPLDHVSLEGDHDSSDYFFMYLQVTKRCIPIVGKTAPALQQQMQSFEAWWPAATGIDEQLKFEVCTCGDGDVDDVQEC